MDARLSYEYQDPPPREQPIEAGNKENPYYGKDRNFQRGEPATPRMLRNDNRRSGSEVREQSGFSDSQAESFVGNKSEDSPRYVATSSNVPNVIPMSRVQTAKGHRVPSGDALKSPKELDYSCSDIASRPEAKLPSSPSNRRQQSELLPPASISPGPKRVQQNPGDEASQGQRAKQEKESRDDANIRGNRQHHTHHHHHQQQQQFHRKSIGDWNFIKTVGAGSMGKVKLAQHNATGELCAVKIVPRAAKLYQRTHANDPPPANAQVAAQRQKEFEKEIARDKRTIREGSLGRLLFHPYICRLYEIVPMTNHYYMLFEYVEGGQMLDYIVSHGSLKEVSARKFARGIALALDYCHRNNVVHRDLKIENIMINSKGDIKIIDFGLSNLYSPKSLLKTYCGSLYFAAPELLSAKPYTGPEVDVWSFGVVLYVLVCGKVPFDDQSVSVLHEKIKRGNVEYPTFLSKECISLLSRMLVVDPSKRASLYEVLTHPWMNKGYDSIVSNFLPKRVPLTLPLDPEIIRCIASFDIGTEQSVLEELTTILSSMEYQMCTENWYKVVKSGRDYASAPNSHILPDPTGGFHPLVSIYYLVLEMQRRKKAKEEYNRQQQLAKDEQDEKLNKAERKAVGEIRVEKRSDKTPQIAFPEQAHTTSPTRFDKTSQSGDYVEDDEQTMPLQQPQSPRSTALSRETLDPNLNKATGFNSLLRRLSSKKHKNSPHKTSEHGTHATYYNTATGGALQKASIMGYMDDSDKGNNSMDPMVRRGVSMKVTAKEKSSSPSTTNLENPQHLKPKLEPKVSSSAKGGHARSSSTSTNAYKYRFGGDQLAPPLPNIELTNATDQIDDDKKKEDNRVMHPTARAKSVGGQVRKEALTRPRRQQHVNDALPNALASQNSDEGRIFNAEDHPEYFHDVALENTNSKDVSQLTEAQIIDQFNHAKHNSMPSIEYPKTLFLKGFFSVQTTSTKPLPVIRYNIISVLSKLGVHFQEVKGGFVCEHTPSFQPSTQGTERNDSLGESQDDRSKSEIEEKKLYGDAFSSESSMDINNTTTTPRKVKTPEQDLTNTVTLQSKPQLTIDSQLSSPPSANSGKTHRSSNSTGGSHRRKFSIGNSLLTSYRKRDNSQIMPPNTPATAKITRLRSSEEGDGQERDDNTKTLSEDDSVDSLNGLMIGGGSDMLISSTLEHRTKNNGAVSEGARRSPLKFEIHIVKVPLVGLYGVQFKKLQGNTWNYKTLASQILNELNL